MGWKRTQFDKKRAKLKMTKAMREKGIRTEGIIHTVSENADNRHYCWGCGKEKYCYETKVKAEKSTEYVSNEQRVYYCKLCSAYHTTSKVKVADVKYKNNGYVDIEEAKDQVE